VIATSSVDPVSDPPRGSRASITSSTAGFFAPGFSAVGVLPRRRSSDVSHQIAKTVAPMMAAIANAA
jgi:hypothetical protein